jgi:serine/threonine protein kinase
MKVDLLSKIHHKNLVTLVGYCVDNNQHMLIYEYVSQGSLFDRLHGASDSQSLDWNLRLNIALNAAQGKPLMFSQD